MKYCVLGYFRKGHWREGEEELIRVFDDRDWAMDWIVNAYRDFINWAEEDLCYWQFKAFPVVEHKKHLEDCYEQVTLEDGRVFKHP